MIELFYSNKTEQLLDALAKTLNGQRFSSHPLEVVELVVPNRNMETWVRLGLAQKLGVAANMRFRRLEQLIGDIVTKTCPGGYKLADLDIIEAAILAVLLDEDSISSPELEPVRGYLESSGKTAQILPGSKGPSVVADSMLVSDGADIRRVQLASRMAYLFQEYSYSRSEMIAAWRDNDRFNMEHRYADPVRLDQDLAPTVAWQRALWRAVFAGGGLLEKKPPPEGGRWITLDQLVAEAELVSIIRTAELSPVHIFGVSYVARLFQNIFALLAENNPLFIYTLNPCAEFWEDVETERAYYRRLDKEKNRREKRIWAEGGEIEKDDPFGLFAADSPALRYWGHPGREHVRLLGELTDCDFTDRFIEPEGGSLLKILQRDILYREPERTEENGKAGLHKPDDTVKLIAAPSVRREVEWVADEIWKLMKNDRAEPPLRFSDIAVIINSAGRDIYLPQVETVFASSHNLPNSVSDLPGTAGSRIFEAMSLLLKLPFGRFSRAEMLAFMSHPAVIGRFSDLSPGDMTTLAEALGIVSGADRTDFAGTYVDLDVYNWDQGIKRLALGAFMTGEKSGDGRIFQVSEDQWLVEEVSGSARKAAARFGMLARSLLQEARFVRSSKMTLRDWAGFYSTQIDTYLHLEDEADKGDRLRLLRALAKLEKMDLGQEVSGRIAAEITGKVIESLGSSRGQYLAEGVVVSSFLPMRVIPFKVIFLLGLGEGLFPAAGSRDALDLRAAARRAGDVDPAERDRYMFLETLLCSRERLYLSYVKRDEQTGDPLQPSAVVQELLHILKQNYLDEEGMKAIRCEPQLRRYEGLDNSGETFFDEARNEAKIRQIAQNWREHALPINDDQPEPGLPALGSLREELNTLQKVSGDEVWHKLSSMLVLPGVAPFPAAVKAVPRVSLGGEDSSLEAPFYLSHSTLRRFLECPMQGWASAMLGLAEAEEDLADREEEDFEVDRLTETVLLRDVFAESLSNGGSPEELYRKRTERLRLAGRFPVGELGRVIEKRHLDIFAGWQATLELLTYNEGGAAASSPQLLERFRLGRSKGQGSTESILDSLRLDLEVKGRDSYKQMIPVHLGGLSDGLLKGQPVTITFLAKKPFSSHGKTAVTGSFRYLLRGLIDQALLAAAGVLGDGERQILLCFSGGPKEAAIYRMRLQPAEREKAQIWLSLLAEDLLSGHHAYLLPVEAVITRYYELAGGGRSQSMLNGMPIKELAACFDGSELVRLIVNMAGNKWSRFSSLWGPVPSPRNYLPPGAEEAMQIALRRFGPLFEDIIALEVVK